jgi:translation initiation factor 2B subunit (eIF-2B alpha/beta/delta family)
VFCCSNEALKVIKEQAKQQQWAADKAIMEEWAAQQERHEAARKAQVSALVGLELQLPLAAH